MKVFFFFGKIALKSLTAWTATINYVMALHTKIFTRKSPSSEVQRLTDVREEATSLNSEIQKFAEVTEVRNGGPEQSRPISGSSK
eukprot:10768884-Karenia_brevis.AAC.1